MKKKTAALAVCTAAVLIVSMAGCKGQTASTGSGSLYTLRIPNLTSDATRVSTLVLSYSKKVLAQNGLKVEDTGTLSATNALPALEAGSIDVTANHINRTISAASAGANVIAVAGNTETTESQPHMVFVVKKDSTINSPADVVGKKLGVANYGGCNEGFMWIYLYKMGGIKDPVGKFTTNITPEANLLQTLDKGEIDIAGVHTTPESIEENYPDVRILFTDWTIDESNLGQAPWQMSKAFIKEHPDIVKKFVASIAAINNYYNDSTHAAEAIKEYASLVKTDASKVTIVHYVTNAYIQPSTITSWVDYMVKFNLIKTKVDADKVYTNEYNPNKS